MCWENPLQLARADQRGCFEVLEIVSLRGWGGGKLC